MSFLGLCGNDPLVNTLRSTFGANPVRVPEERIQPLCALAFRDGKAAFRGALAPLLTGGQNFTVPNSARAQSTMADLSEKRSASVSLSLGLDILGGFLAGFGIPSAGIHAKFAGATEVAFSFSSVNRDWVDDNWLGRALVGLSLDRQTVAARLFTDKPRWDLLVIDSVITSSQFTISVTKSNSDSFAIDIPGIQSLVASAKVQVDVESKSQRQVTFRGAKALTFAFTTVRLYVDDHGNIQSMPPGGDLVVLSVAQENTVPTYGLDHIQLSGTPAMVVWDEIG